MASDIEKRIGLEILRKIQSLQLPLKLDDITQGRGNCFTLAILAQCRRPEIFQQLDGSMQYIICQNDPTELRQQVHRFMVNSTHPKIHEYKRRYEEVISVIDNRSWNEYWEVMIRGLTTSLSNQQLGFWAMTSSSLQQQAQKVTPTLL